MVDGSAYWKIKMTRETKETRETTTKSGIIFLCCLCCLCCPCYPYSLYCHNVTGVWPYVTGVTSVTWRSSAVYRAVRSVIDSRVCGANCDYNSYVSELKYKQRKIATELHRPK